MKKYRVEYLEDSVELKELRTIKDIEVTRKRRIRNYKILRILSFLLAIISFFTVCILYTIITNILEGVV